MVEDILTAESPEGGLNQSVLNDRNGTNFVRNKSQCKIH